MGLLQEWREYAYAVEFESKTGQAIWKKYFDYEKKVYEALLQNPEEVEQGTVQGLADKYGMDVLHMTGFLDGINDSLKEPNDIENMTAETEVKLPLDLEKLYFNMVLAKAKWLYEMPVWDELLSEEKRKEIYMSSKNSGTVRNDQKVGRNDPCPCGSGKKYKFCCGRN
ncbi:MAG: SEC-C domain-containing protein [Lachnospiraceae bacterium]|nr:SEC-C domain-containing protein [Lachnospiraceae bacterium]